MTSRDGAGTIRAASGIRSRREGSARADVRPSAVDSGGASSPASAAACGLSRNLVPPRKQIAISPSISHRSTSSVTAEAADAQRRAARVVLPFPEGPMKAIARPPISTALAWRVERPSAASA